MRCHNITTLVKFAAYRKKRLPSMKRSSDPCNGSVEVLTTVTAAWKEARTLSHSDSRIPSGNRSINRGEEERRRFAWGQQEIGWAAVAMVPVGVPVGVFVIRIGWRDRDDQDCLVPAPL